MRFLFVFSNVKTILSGVQLVALQFLINVSFFLLFHFCFTFPFTLFKFRFY